MKQQTAKLNNLRIAPRKVRFVADLLRGLSTSEAEAQLLLQNRRSAAPLLKLLRSAITNAVNNQKIARESLRVKQIYVGQGVILKRFMPRAQGRAAAIHKKFSNVSLVLEEVASKNKPRFNILPPVKKDKKNAAKTRTEKPKVSEKEWDKPKEKTGFIKRFFQRKTV